MSDSAPDPDAAPGQIPEYLPLAEADPKPWSESRGVLFALLAAWCQVLLLLSLAAGFSTASLATLAAISLLCALAAAWGRVRAQQPIARPRCPFAHLLNRRSRS